MIKSVLFDMGNVLLCYDAKRAGLRFAKECKVPLLKLWTHFFTSEVEKAYTRGEMTSHQFYKHSKQVLKFPVNYKTFQHYWNDIFWENPGMEPLLRQLKKKYPLYVISNTNEMHFSYIKKKFPHVFQHFKKTFPSHEMGCRKPDTLIFEKVLKIIKLKPEETVFIDDVKKFVDGAKAAGMHAIRFRNVPQMVKDLKKLGVTL